MPKITVLARVTPRPGREQPPMVVDVAAQERRIKKFIGWRFVAMLGEEFDHYVEQSDGSLTVERRLSGGFVATNLPETIELRPSTPEHTKHYLDALRDGDLLPADAETAALAGVDFVPPTPPEQEAPAALPTQSEGAQGDGDLLPADAETVDSGGKNQSKKKGG